MICIYCGERIDELNDLYFDVGNEAIHGNCASLAEKSFQAISEQKEEEE